MNSGQRYSSGIILIMNIISLGQPSEGNVGMISNDTSTLYVNHGEHVGTQLGNSAKDGSVD